MDKNFEFNVELRDYDDVVFANETFEDLWKEAIDILPYEIANVKKDTFLNDEFSPFDLYIKSLKEYLISLSGGGAQPNISQKIIRDLKIPLPPLSV